MRARISISFLLIFCLLTPHSLSFQSDELLVDDEEFGLEGAPVRPVPDVDSPRFTTPSPLPTTTTTTTRRRSSDSDSDSKVQFTLEHAFGDSEFTPAGTFTARLKSGPHGGQVTNFRTYPLCFSAQFWIFHVGFGS